MQRLTENKIILITRKTRLDDLITRFNSVMQAKFYVEHMGKDFNDYQTEHDLYYAAVDIARQQLSTLGRVQDVDRSLLPNFIFGKDDVAVAVGQDGLVANTMKYLTGQPLVGVNPDPARWDGVLLPFTANDLKLLLPEVFAKKRPMKDVSIGKAELNDGQILLAVNDFYIGQRTHVSSRYVITLGDRSETHSSSGIIVSTGLGASGWLKSVLAGAQGISSAIANKKTRDDKHALSVKDLTWGSDFLCFSVREPFPSRSSQAGLVFGTVRNEQPLKVLSLMGENGVIFSDGVEQDFLSFNSGIEATIKLAGHKGQLVV